MGDGGVAACSAGPSGFIARRLQVPAYLTTYDRGAQALEVLFEKSQETGGLRCLVVCLPPTLGGVSVVDPFTCTEKTRMGDKSPKSKKREQQQNAAEKAQKAAKAKQKQDGQNRAAANEGKGKKNG